MPEEKDKVMLEKLAKVMDITKVNVAYEKMGGKQTDFTFSWEDINYSVEQGDELKQILTGVTGKCKSGELIAIMGGSGAGKTSLLNVLAGRIGPGNLTGTILLDGYKRNKKNWQRDCAYVEQDDLLHATLTVQETLDYSAKFRLHDGCTLAERREKVNEVIMDLGLNGCRNSFIGNENIRGVSGGERKRVSIGQELLTTPHILFLDEPTSGLDAFTSFNIINTMKQIAVKRNKIVIMTIHQPRTDIINLIDKVLLLSSGKTMWLGSTKDALVHFSSLGYVIPPKTNPSDFFMDTLTLDQRDPEKLAASKARVDNSKVAWDMYYKKQTATEATFPTMSSTISIATPAKNPFKELRTLLGRDFLLISRNTSPMKVLFFQSIGIIALLGSMFFQSNLDSVGVQNRIGIIYFLLIALHFTAAMPSITATPLERTLIKRERSAASYSAYSAFISKWICGLPSLLGSSMFLVLPLYFIVGLNTSDARFWKFVFVIIAHVVTSNAFGMFMGASMPTVTLAMIYGPLCMTVFMMFGGLTVDLDHVPEVFRWIQYVSPIAWANKALVQNELSGVPLVCDNPLKICFKNGEAVISYLSFGKQEYWLCAGSLAALTLGFLIIGMIFFERLSRPNLRLKI